MEKLCTILILCSLFIACTNAIATTKKEAYHYEAEKWVQNYLSKPREKVAKLHYYIQDVLSGPNATVWEVARAEITSNTTTLFGQVMVLDDLITSEPDPNSKKLGRAQGVITSADLRVTGLAMHMNHVFTDGPYNGSTLSISGRNPLDSNNRELPIVGGSGVFRMARGFGISNTYSYDPVANYGVIEYTVYVFYV